jgi:methionyl-tRNA synthetase
MSDEEEGWEQKELTAEEVHEILDWAVDVATTLTLMVHEVIPENDEDRAAQLERFTIAIVSMYDALPEVVVEPAHILAHEVIDEMEEQEKIVEKFREQIEKEL